MSIINLRWRDTNKGTVDEHRVYRSKEPMSGVPPFPPIAILPGDATSFTDTTTVRGETYYYVVSARKDGKEKVSISQKIMDNDCVYAVTTDFYHKYDALGVELWRLPRVESDNRTEKVSIEFDPRRNRVYVCEHVSHVIVIDSAKGEFLPSIPITLADGFARYDIDSDCFYLARFYSVSNEELIVEKYDVSGNLLVSEAHMTSGDSLSSYPRNDIAISADYVAFGGHDSSFGPSAGGVCRKDDLSMVYPISFGAAGFNRENDLYTLRRTGNNQRTIFRRNYIPSSGVWDDGIDMGVTSFGSIAYMLGSHDLSIYIRHGGQQDGEIEKFNERNEVVFTSDISADALSLSSDDVLYVGDGSTLYKMDGKTGDIAWSVEAPRSITELAAEPGLFVTQRTKE